MVVVVVVVGVVVVVVVVGRGGSCMMCEITSTLISLEWQMSLCFLFRLIPCLS